MGSVRDDRGTGDGPLGTCQHCETTIPRSKLAVKYEAPGGWPRLLAECPSCERVVSPR